MRFLTNDIDCLEDFRQLIFDFFVCKADRLNSKVTDQFGAFGIVFPLGLVDFTIDFDDKSSSMTVKIGKEFPDDLLPAKVPAGAGWRAGAAKELFRHQSCLDAVLLPAELAHW